MRYLGGKSKIAKRLASIIGGGEILIEPFIGGGAMTAVLAQKFRNVYAYDIHPDLILMWQALQKGWQPPKNISKEEYLYQKISDPSPERGFVGFAGASWGGKWFGGYARGDNRNYADEASRSLLRDIKLMSNVVFSCDDYRNIKPIKDATVYADPPYSNTTGYGTDFDNDEFWFIMNQWVETGSKVFVSEYKAPNDWNCVWELERTRDMKAHLTDAVKVTERLFTKIS